MTAQDENRDVSRTEDFDPFPKPQTIPAGWDTSELFTAPQPDSVTESDTPAETGDR